MSHAMGLRLVAFDLDGVLYRGPRVLSHAREGVQAVRERGLLVRYVTNNATLHRAAVAARLQEMGFSASVDEVIGSASATAAWLGGRIPLGSLVAVVGEAGLVQELSEAGFRTLRAEEGALADPPAAAVVVGLDRAFTYHGLAVAQHHLLSGALFVATNTDATYPAEGHLLPGAGSVVAAVATVASREPVVIGKPALGMAEALRLTSGVPFDQMLLVGDRLDTDIAFGERAGMHTALVLTGVHGRRDIDQLGVCPEFVLEDLSGLAAVLDALL